MDAEILDLGRTDRAPRPTICWILHGAWSEIGVSRRQRVGLAALYPTRQVDCMRCAGKHQGLQRHDQDRVAKFLPNNPLANEIREDINIDNAWNLTIRPGPYCRQRINSERLEIRIGALSEVSGSLRPITTKPQGENPDETPHARPP